MSSNNFDSILTDVIEEHFLSFPRKLEFILTPIRIHYCPYITPTEKSLYSEIRALDNSETGCYASNDYFAKILGSHPNAISTMISKLIKIGIVIKESFDGRRRILRSNDAGIIPYYVRKLKEDLEELASKQATQTKSNHLGRLNQTIKADLIKSLTLYNKDNSIDNNIEKSISKDILRNSRKEFPPLKNLKTSQEEKYTSQKTVHRRTAPPREPPPLKEWITSGWKKTILDMWNQIPDVRKHNDLTTKTICRAAKALEHLSRGSFFDHYKISESFISKNNIPSSWIVKKKAITQRQIFTAVSKYHLYFKHGYWPTNKDSLPRSLDSFIYNDHTGGSFLLRLIVNPDIKSIAEERKDKDPNPQYTKYFQEKGLLKQFTKDEMGLVYSGIRAIENRVLSGDIFKFDDWSGRNNTRKIKEVIGQGKQGKLEPIFKNYASYLGQRNRLEKEKIFSVYGYFQEFLISIRDYYSSFEVNI